jgi:hypothetical protein
MDSDPPLDRSILRQRKRLLSRSGGGGEGKDRAIMRRSLFYLPSGFFRYSERNSLKPSSG